MNDEIRRQLRQGAQLRQLDQVGLRPAGEEDLPMLEKLTLDPQSTGDFGWFGWFDPLLWRRKWTENELIGPDGGVLIVISGGERLGLVNWRRQPCTPSAWYWEIGVALLPGFRRQGLGTQAHRLLVTYLFAHTPVHRIEAATEVDNIAEQRALEKAGFTREGVRREGGWRQGAYRDGVIYGLLRTDPRG
jgi:RimJ/RimL family protein N-acetyltransferase